MFVDDLTRLREMLDIADDMTSFTAGRSRADLDTDKLLATSMVHWIQVFGEASRLLSATLKESNPDVDWHKIVGMRHRIVHDYTQVDRDIVWDVCTVDVPGLIPRLRRIRESLEDSPL